jgi:uncharacterized protein (TIGR03437 family)
MHPAGSRRRLRLKSAAVGLGPVVAVIVFLLLRSDARSANRPVLQVSNVVNAANLKSGGVTPGEILILYPAGAGPRTMVAWPTRTVGATRVFFDGIAAPVVYSEAGQMESIVPLTVAKSRATRLVVEYNGVKSRSVRLAVVGSAPAIFTLDATGKGQAAMLNETGCCNSSRNPATRGSISNLYATGEGAPVLKGSEQIFPIKVTVGGVSAEVTYAGNLGVLSVNFRVPLNAPVGSAVPIVLTAGSYSSSPDVTMAVQSQARAILVIEHEAAVRARLSQILEAAGYEVFAAADTRAASPLAGDHRVDLVISGIEQNEGQTLALLDSMRQEHPLLRTAVITKDVRPAHLKAADLLGAQAVLTNPLQSDTVVSKIRELLKEQPARY